MSTIMAYDKDGNEDPIPVHALALAMGKYNDEEQDKYIDRKQGFFQYMEDKFGIFGLHDDWFEYHTSPNRSFITISRAGVSAYLAKVMKEGNDE